MDAIKIRFLLVQAPGLAGVEMVESAAPKGRAKPEVQPDKRADYPKRAVARVGFVAHAEAG